jgi:hypothetical protein
MRLIDLIPLQEIDFPSQGAFDRYNKQHKLRPDTKVVVAGRVTTAGRASQNSAPVKGTSIFNKDAEKNAQSSLANDKESPFKVTYVDDKGNTQIANTFKSKDDADNYASHFSPSSQVKVVSADDDKLKKYGDKSGDYPVGSLQYRLQKNNPKDAVKYDNQSKSPSKVKIGDVNVTKDKQTGIVHLQDTNTYGNRPFTNTSILPKDIPNVIKHISQPNPIKFRITSVNSIYKDTFVTKSNDGITITDKSKKYWPTVRFKSNELPNLIKYLQQIS